MTRSPLRFCLSALLVQLAWGCSTGADTPQDDALSGAGTGGAPSANAGSAGAPTDQATTAGVGGAAPAPDPMTGNVAGAGDGTSAGAPAQSAGASSAGQPSSGAGSAGMASTGGSAGAVSDPEVAGQAGAGSAGGPAAGAAGAMSMPLEPGDCVNNRRDGDETGVDCGGSCPTCPDYDYGQPVPGNESRSGCEANGDGFMCAQSMALSPEMKAAAGDDWGAEDPPFVYGVVGHDPDVGGVDGAGASYNSACCQCYQLVFRAPMDGSVSLTVPKPMIVQGFNTYAGGPSAFDVYMAAGGHGNFNGCTANGTQYTGYPDLGGDWTGGVRATRYQECRGGEGMYTPESVASDQCQDHIAGECAKITSGEPTQAISQQSCELANRPETHYHANWFVAVKRVQCPVALTEVTGCRLADQGLPAADPAITTFDQAIAAGFGERSPNASGDQEAQYHTTTMQDCCRPTCAWDTNTQNTADGYNRFYTCDDTGQPH